MAAADDILQVEHLTMRFGGLVAVGDVTFSARRGEITALIGPNGAGKTTVFNCITGFYKPTEGMMTLRAKDGSSYLLERLPGHEVNRTAHVARTFQNIRLFSGMTVLENLLVAQHNELMKASGFTILGLLGSPRYRQAKEESMELAKHWLEKADLLPRADEAAGSLPYGDQRRLEIARAMCTKPELLCLDEPAAGLNPKESLALNGLLNYIKSTGTSLLLIEHDMSVVMQISDHVVVLEYGRKISDGDPDFVKNDPRVIAAYLGVEDEEVGEVLVEVGDEKLAEKLELDTMPTSSVEAVEEASDTPAEAVIAPVAAAAAVMPLVSANETVEKSPPAPVAPAVQPEPEMPARAKPAARKVASKPVASRTVKSREPTKVAPAKPAVAKPAPKPAKATPPAVAKAPAKPAAAKPAPKAEARPAPKAATVKPASKPVAARPVAKPAPKAVAPAKSAAPKPAPKPALKPAKPVADDLLLIKGIGPINKRKLNEHGVHRFEQIAAWKRDDVAAAEAYLEFDGRIAREDWIGQARVLAAQAARKSKGSK